MVVNPAVPLELFIVLGECFEDILNTGKHEGVDFFLVFPGKLPELSWKGKGDQIILGRQAFA